jgi:hypothetical protein
MACLLVLSGCNKGTTTAPGQQASVSLNDGTTFSGTVTSSSASAITLQSPTGESRTYPMSQVTSVQYGQGSSPAGQAQNAAPPPAGTSAPPPVSSAPVATVAPPAPPTDSAPPQPVEEFRTIPAGSKLVVRNNDTIDSQTAAAGQTFAGVVEEAVVDTDGRVAIPRGSSATLVVRDATGQGKMQGQSELAVDVASVDVGGRHYRLETSGFVEKGKQGVGTNKRTGAFVGGGAALGGIIGAIAGGGKGAAIGALSGAGAGTATQALTRGKSVRIPSETVLTFKLEAPIRIRELR